MLQYKSIYYLRFSTSQYSTDPWNLDTSSNDSSGRAMGLALLCSPTFGLLLRCIDAQCLAGQVWLF